MTILYCGSFNPLHIGHLAILRTLCQCEEVQRVLLVVSPKNPLKDGISNESAQERFEASVAALNRHPELSEKVQVSDIELNMPAPHYTIRTLEKLVAMPPAAKGSAPLTTQPAAKDATGSGALASGYALAIGGDQLADFRRWKDYDKILLNFGVWVYPRQGFDSMALREDLLLENPAYRIRLLDAEEVHISSTQIRNGEGTPDNLM